VEEDRPGSVNVRAIITPEAFDLMPVGSLVSEQMVWRKEVICSAEPPLEWLGIRFITAAGMKVVNGVSVVKTGYRGVQYTGQNLIFQQTKVYTTPELEPHGIGFALIDPAAVTGGISFAGYLRVKCQVGGVQYSLGVTGLIPNPITAPQPILWHRPENYFHHGYCNSNPSYGPMVAADVGYAVFFQFIKIGNPSGPLPAAVTAPLFTFQLYERNGNSQNLIRTTNFSWSISNFPSRVLTRTCTTPTASQSLIYLGTFTPGEITAMYTGQEKQAHDFNFTFECPHAGYNFVSFFVESVYGVNYMGGIGNLRLAQGSGMARGVGIRLRIKDGGLWKNVVYRPVSMPNSEIGAEGGNYLLYRQDPANNVDPLTETALHPHEINFRASLIRLNEPVVAGQIKAAAIIHIRYN